MKNHALQLSDQKLQDLYVVTQFADASVNSTGYLWALLIQSAEQAGYRVRVISPRAVWPAYIPKALIKLITTLSLLIACLRRLPRHSTVLCATNPVFLPLALSLVHWVKRVKVFVVIHDLFPQNAVVAGYVAASSRSYRGLRAVFRIAYQSCAGVVVIGRDMQQVARGWLGPDLPIEYVANWVPATPLARPQTLPRTAKDRHICRFQYFGNLGALQGLDVVLDGIARSHATNARFDFIGTGASAAAIAAHPILARDTRISLHPTVAFADRNAVLGACDVSLVTLRPQMYGLAVPSKAYFSFANGVPILYMGDTGSELHLTLQEAPALGRFVPAGNAQALADTIDQLCTMPPDPDFGPQAAKVMADLHPDQALRKIMAFINR